MDTVSYLGGAQSTATGSTGMVTTKLSLSTNKENTQTQHMGKPNIYLGMVANYFSTTVYL